MEICVKHVEERELALGAPSGGGGGGGLGKGAPKHPIPPPPHPDVPCVPCGYLAPNQPGLCCVVTGEWAALGGTVQCFALWIFVTMTVPPSATSIHL